MDGAGATGRLGPVFIFGVFFRLSHLCLHGGRFLRCLRGAEFQQRFALVLQVQRRMGRARGLAITVGVHSGRLDLRGCDLLAPVAGGHAGAGVGCNGSDQHRLFAVPDRHVESVRAATAAGADGRARSQPAASGLRAGSASTHALHGLCRVLGSFCVRHRRIARWTPGRGLGALVASLDVDRLGLSGDRYRPGFLVGLL